MSGGLDPTQAALAEPPREPAPLDALTVDVLTATGTRVAARAITMGLHQWSWGEGTVLYALGELADARGEPVPPFVTGFLEPHLAAGVHIGHVNDLICGATCARLWTATGDDRYRTACEHLLAWLTGNATRAANGAIEHWPDGVWADTAFMAGLFLLRYGHATGRPDLVAEAGRQLVAHGEVLQHPGTGLYAHGSHKGETVWCFWGRANAWAALAAAEFLTAAPDDPSAAEVAQRLERQLTALADLQPPHGVWDVLVDGQVENRGILETSAAAGIGAAMLRAAALGIAPERLRTAGRRAVAGVHPYVEPDGTLARTSAGTVLQLIPFGYSVIRTDRIQPWGQGLAMRMYAEAIRTASITEEPYA